MPINYDNPFQNNYIFAYHDVVLKSGKAYSSLQVIYEQKLLPSKLMIKYLWYFKLLEAKERVLNPRNVIKLETYKSNYEDIDLDREYCYRLRSRIVRKKQTVTMLKSNFNLFIDSYNELFPIDNDPLYLKYLHKLNLEENELECLIAEFSTKNVYGF